jgi:Flp pilus assembly protein TadG
MVEFALVAPVFIFMLVGIIEVGRYTYFAIIAAHAARAGVQFAAQNLTTAADAAADGPNTANAASQDAQQLAQFQVKSWVVCTANSQPATCPTSDSTTTISSGLVYYVAVQVSGTFNPMLKYPGIPTDVPISATATMRVGNQ